MSASGAQTLSDSALPESREAARLAEELRRVQTVSLVLATTTTANEIARALVDHRALLGAVSAGFWVFSDDGLTAELLHGVSSTENPQRFRLQDARTDWNPLFEACEKREPVWIESFLEHIQRYPSVAARLDPATPDCSVLNLPLVFGDRCIAGLSLSFERTTQLDPLFLVALQSVAAQAAQAMERARLLEAEQTARRKAEAHADRLRRLQRVTAALSGAATVEEVARAVVVEALAVEDLRTGALWLVSEDGRELEFVSAHGSVSGVAERFARIPLHPAQTYPGVVAVLTQQPVWINSREEAERVLPAIAAWMTTRASAYSLVALPLFAAGRCIGTVGFSYWREHEFDADEQEFFLAVGRQTSIALERARALADERRARSDAEAAHDRAAAEKRRTERLQAVTSALSRALTPYDVANTIASEGVLALDAAMVLVGVVAPDGTALDLLGNRGLNPVTAEAFRRIPIELNLPLTALIKDPQPRYFTQQDDYLQLFPDFRRELTEHCYGAAIMLPLATSRGVLGSLVMRFADERRFTQEDRHLIENVAAQGALALERAQSFEREHQARRAAESSEARLRLLADASAVLAEEHDLSVAAEHLASLLVPAFADGCGIELLGPSGAVETCAYANTNPAVIPLMRQLRSGFTQADRQHLPSAAALETGKAQSSDSSSPSWHDAVARNAEHLALMRSITPRYVLSAPLIARDRRLGVIFFGRDSADQPFTSDEKRWSEDLGHRVAVAFDNKRLHSELQHAVRTRDEFISILGHELRTPVTAFNIQLSSVTRLLVKDPAQLITRLPEKLQVMRRQVVRLSGLIDQFLDVYAIVSGQLQLYRAPTDLVALTRSVIDALEPERRTSGSTLTFHADASLEGFWDPPRMTQVITSLVSNAIKYGEGRPIDIRLDRRGDQALIEVADRGIGIAPEAQARIFGRFDRAVSARNYGGFGLGLWTAKQILDGHGGRILVQSKVNEGSTFTVLLPLTMTEQP